MFFIYNDRPGVLGQIAASLAAESVNIDDVRNPHNLKGTKSIAILKVNQKVSDEVVSRIQGEIQAEVGCYLDL